MQTVLVTGGAGFLGRSLVRRIAGKANVVVVDSLDRQVHPSESFPRDVASRAKCIRADIRNPRDYESEIGDVNLVVHLAAQTGTAQSMYELSRYTDTNVGGTAALLEALERNKTRPSRIILASSRAVYGEGVYRKKTELLPATRKVQDLCAGRWEPVGPGGKTVETLPMQAGQPTEPTSVYGLTKLWQEQLVQSFCAARQIDCTALRFQNVFGPGQSPSNPYTGIIGYLAARISAGEEVELYEDGRMSRDFLFVDDASAIIDSIMDHRGPLPRVFDAGSGTQTTLLDLSRMIGAILHKEVKMRISGRFRQGDVRHAVADRSTLDSVFRTRSTTTLEAGLKKYCEWFSTQPTPGIDPHRKALHQLQSRGLFHSSHSSSAAS